MRKLILIFAVVAAAAIGIAAAFAATNNSKAPNRAAAAPQRAQSAGDRDVAAVLGLTGANKAALAKAQALGRQATACLLAHGATQRADGGLADPTEAAYQACIAKIEANEAFLSSPEFAAVLKAAQPKFDAAEKCYRRISQVPAGTIIHDPEKLPADVKRRLDAAQTTCFRPDGLPR
jgi:hypothetical protein